MTEQTPDTRIRDTLTEHWLVNPTHGEPRWRCRADDCGWTSEGIVFVVHDAFADHLAAVIETLVREREAEAVRRIEVAIAASFDGNMDGHETRIVIARALYNRAAEQATPAQPEGGLGRNLHQAGLSNINEREDPRGGVWSPMLGPCIRTWLHTHDDETRP